MVEPTTIGLVLGGALLLLFGAVLSTYGVALLGVVVGGGAGYLLGPTIGGVANLEGTAAEAGAVVIGAIAGIVITFLLLKIAIVVLSFTVGTYLGVVAVGPALGDGTAMGILIGLGVGVGAAALGLFMKRTAIVLITSFLGAALASRSVTQADIATASSDFTLDPILFEPAAPVFAGLFALGILSQFGLFKLGYVTKVAALLPGASVLRDGEEAKAAEA